MQLSTDSERAIVGRYRADHGYWSTRRAAGERVGAVGIFPDDPSLIRLVSMLAIEANDEWLVGRSYISKQSMASLYDNVDRSTLSPRSQEEVGDLIAA
jgi:hypothetical protein